MRVIKSPRGTGKTTELIKMSNKTKYPILVLSEDRKRNLQRMAKEMGLTIGQVYTYSSSFQAQGVHSPFLIDDCDELLEYILRVKVAGITTC